MGKKNTSPIKEKAEEKIKNAARKLFTQKGYAATRTRDIAEEAGINLALLNYYFRSKEKLFDLIMAESLENFVGGIAGYFEQTELSLEEKITYIVSAYIDLLIENPDLPIFILHEIQSGNISAGNKPGIAQKAMGKVRTAFFKEIETVLKLKKKNIHPMHIVANVIGLTVFPFIARPMLTERMNHLSIKQFNELMLERKKLIPQWIKLMLQ